MIKLESVRVLHAQGVPNHYIANQIYQPADEHERRGSFVILFDHDNTPNGAFVASLINTIVRDYYRPSSPVGLDGFEQSLLRLNEQIKQYSRSQDGEPVKLNGIIALYHEQELHISHIGHGEAFLYREESIIPLNEATKKESDSAQAFSLITSGEIKNSDTLIIVTGIAAKDPETLKKSIIFSVNHTPLFESGRALARLLQQENEATAEAIFVRFGDESGTTQVYVDRPLETREEKLERYQKAGNKLLGHVLTGVKKATESGAKAYATIQKKRAPEQDTIEQIIDKEPETPLPSSDAELESSDSQITENPDQPEPDEPKEAAIPEADGFAVTAYWQRKAAAAASPSPKIDADTTVAQPHTPPTDPAYWIDRIKKIKPRTAYILLGTAILLFIVIKIFNGFSGAKLAEAPSTAERDALITTAETSAREADAAQVQDDTTLAIEKLLATNEALAKIPDGSQNEKSKALARRTEELLGRLTKTTILPSSETIATLPAFPAKVITAKNIPYFFYKDKNGQKLIGSELTKLSTPDNFQTSDAVIYADGQKIALYGKQDNENKIYSVNTDTNEVKESPKSDGKPWPDARLLASFESNLYLVSDKITKATPDGDKYRTIAYPGDMITTSVTNILNNGGVFYALEDNKNLIRIAANAPKTLIKLFGAPERFMPTNIARLISTGKEGQIYFFDTKDQRIMLFTTDGGYRQQYTLPQGEDFVDCDATEKTFVCVNKDKQVKSFTIQ